MVNFYINTLYYIILFIFLLTLVNISQKPLYLSNIQQLTKLTKINQWLTLVNFLKSTP